MVFNIHHAHCGVSRSFYKIDECFATNICEINGNHKLRPAKFNQNNIYTDLFCTLSFYKKSCQIRLLILQQAIFTPSATAVVRRGIVTAMSVRPSVVRPSVVNIFNCLSQLMFLELFFNIAW